MNSADEKLIAFFTGRKLPPKGYFQISGWESTFNIKNTVDLAIIGLRSGDSASRDTLLRIREKLEPSTKTEL
ncbi:hypothetical protein [Spirosoma linguale]|uniref:Uncharacterized protein n=1 Tax=Spirosoma linguale (strain ATCC 33905 / DSM 74 / LMG 10896 / Claus 1) TaxID=504472 RepID=D2QJJ0_SPILD|nr:hypothetical protein Slin_2890 [Spirosoma linguale DSM 74]